MNTYAQSKLLSKWISEYISAMVNKEPKTQFPLPCGCTSPKYICMCEAHKALERERQLELIKNREQGK